MSRFIGHSAALAVVILVAAPSVSAGEASRITLTVDGAPSARFEANCDFSTGGTDSFDASPPFMRSWTVDGISCDIRQVEGPGALTIEVRRDGNVTRISTGGVGSKVRVRQNFDLL